MSSRVRRPDTVTLPISRGDVLVVKKHLTAGETRAVMRRWMKPGLVADQIDALNIGHSKCVGYLVDWSIMDADEKRIVILDQSDEVKGAALDAIDADAFREILSAVEAHETAMDQERAAEKNAAGEITSAPISPSLSGATGPTSTSPS